MQISEASIKDMLKQGKSTKEVLLAFGFSSEAMDPSLVSLFSTMVAILIPLLGSVDSMDSSIQDVNSKIDALTNLLIEKNGKNSTNSSLPPSKDGYRKPSPKSIRAMGS